MSPRIKLKAHPKSSNILHQTAKCVIKMGFSLGKRVSHSSLEYSMNIFTSHVADQHLDDFRTVSCAGVGFFFFFIWQEILDNVAIPKLSQYIGIHTNIHFSKQHYKWEMLTYLSGTLCHTATVKVFQKRLLMIVVVHV